MRFDGLSCLSSLFVAALVFACGCGGGDSGKPTGGGPSTPSSSGDSDGSAAADGGDTDSSATDSGDGADIATGGWGTLSGRFVFDGDPPARNKAVVNKDTEVCGTFDLRDEQLIVAEDGGLADVILWLRTEDTPVSEDYAAKADAAVELDNIQCRFEPHVVALRLGQTLNIKNSDPVAHNTQIGFSSNQAFNEGISTGASKDLKPTKDERYPVDVSCSIHPWMRAYLVVQDTPYMAVTAADGTFEIANLPTGLELEFQVYHPKSKQVSEVTMGGKPTTWKRGRFAMKIAEGDNDLGDLLVSPKQFE